VSDFKLEIERIVSDEMFIRSSRLKAEYDRADEYLFQPENLSGQILLC
jgi:hypothetical protein